MEKKRILVCDDEESYLEMITNLLEDEGFMVIQAMKGQEAIEKASKSLPDLIILDWRLPDISGLEVTRKLRQKEKTKSIPIIMLTIKSSESDTVLGLEVGADDYMTKPFSGQVLLARIRANIRRKKFALGEDEHAIEDSDISINLDYNTCSVKGKKIDLTFQELHLLFTLLKRKNKVLTRNFLTETVWGFEYFGTTRVVDMTIARLRKKLGSYGNYIETIKNVGYRFSKDIE